MKTKQKIIQVTDKIQINKPQIQELYEGEIHDLIITSLQKASRGCDSKSRSYELLQGLLKENDEIGIGRKAFETVKAVFSTGEALNKKRIAILESVGIELRAGGKHQKLCFFGNEKYCFTVATSPSDDRYGKNLASDIAKALSVYR